MNKFDYISILAGGKCGFNCSFCIGNDIRINEKPHFSNKYNSFIDLFASHTKLLSVSGSTSDPCFISEQEHQNIILLAKKENHNIKINVHTRTLKYENLKMLNKYYDKIVISIDENFKPFEYLKEFKNIRYSIVLTENNFNVFTLDWFENIYKTIGHSSFTLRPNVFDSNIKTFSYGKEVKNKYLPKEAIQFPFHQGLIVIWNFKDINDNLNVRYLWSDDTVSSQCEWKKLY